MDIQLSCFVTTVLILQCSLLLTIIAAKRGDYVGSVSPDAQTSWGDWGPSRWCFPGQYAYGFRQKVEWGDSTDHTALNGIQLFCKSADGQRLAQGIPVTSTVSRWGDWGASKICPCNTFLTGARIKSEPKQDGDDTAANNMAFICQNNHALVGVGRGWGVWSSYAMCPRGSAICGIKTLVEKDQGGLVDDTALNDVILHCCSKSDTSTC